MKFPLAKFLIKYSFLHYSWFRISNFKLESWSRSQRTSRNYSIQSFTSLYWYNLAYVSLCPSLVESSKYFRELSPFYYSSLWLWLHSMLDISILILSMFLALNFTHLWLTHSIKRTLLIGTCILQIHKIFTRLRSKHYSTTLLISCCWTPWFLSRSSFHLKRWNSSNPLGWNTMCTCTTQFPRMDQFRKWRCSTHSSMKNLARSTTFSLIR